MDIRLAPRRSRLSPERTAMRPRHSPKWTRCHARPPPSPRILAHAHRPVAPTRTVTTTVLSRTRIKNPPTRPSRAQHTHRTPRSSAHVRARGAPHVARAATTLPGRCIARAAGRTHGARYRHHHRRRGAASLRRRATCRVDVVCPAPDTLIATYGQRHRATADLLRTITCLRRCARRSYLCVDGACAMTSRS
jgi:hypothetical protein